MINDTPQFDVIIVGSGPAAYIAGLYSATAKFKTIIYEIKSKDSVDYANREKIPGLDLDNIKSNEDFNEILRQQTSRFEVSFSDEKIVNVELGKTIFLETAMSKVSCKVIIIDDLCFFKSMLSSFNVESNDSKSQKTNYDNVFLCGSASNIEREAILYCGSGCTAALDAKDYINGL